jgi:hypothetical protein
MLAEVLDLEKRSKPVRTLLYSNGLSTLDKTSTTMEK